MRAQTPAFGCAAFSSLNKLDLLEKISEKGARFPTTVTASKGTALVVAA
jgi:hypothetical protein